MPDQVLIFFVPTNAAQSEFERAFREQIGSLQFGENAPPENTKPVAVKDNDQLPLWTWFVPDQTP